MYAKSNVFHARAAFFCEELQRSDVNSSFLRMQQPNMLNNCQFESPWGRCGGFATNCRTNTTMTRHVTIGTPAEGGGLRREAA